MATTTLNDRSSYLPNRTLGRSGYQSGPVDRLHERANQLDALLCVITSCTAGDEAEGFFNCNNQIQRSVLELASSLATEINEIQEEMSYNSLGATQPH